MDNDTTNYEENIILDDYDDNNNGVSSGSQFESGPNHMGYAKKTRIPSN